eukprot:COSAG05_NODE_548_length_8749_cov_33.055838_16_plen_192_part_01
MKQHRRPRRAAVAAGACACTAQYFPLSCPSDTYSCMLGASRIDILYMEEGAYRSGTTVEASSRRQSGRAGSTNPSISRTRSGRVRVAAGQCTYMGVCSSGESTWMPHRSARGIEDIYKGGGGGGGGAPAPGSRRGGGRRCRSCGRARRRRRWGRARAPGAATARPHGGACLGAQVGRLGSAFEPTMQSCRVS